MRRYERGEGGYGLDGNRDVVRRECLAPLYCIPHFPPQYRPTLTAKVRVRSPPHRGTLTLARKQGREGGCGGGMPTGCPARVLIGHISEQQGRLSGKQRGQ